MEIKQQPTIEDIDSSVPLSDEYVDNSSLSWIKPLDEDGVLNISTEDTIALIGGVQYYSGIDTLDIVALEDGKQYTLSMLQRLVDEDGLKYTKLSLERLGESYAINS